MTTDFNLSEFKQRQASLEKLARDLRIKRDEYILDTILPGWKEMIRIDSWLKKYWPGLFPPSAQPRWSQKLKARAKKFIKHIKGYRIVHEDDQW